MIISKRETYISGTVDPDKNWRVFLLHSLAWIFRNPTKQSARRQLRFFSKFQIFVGSFLLYS